MFQLAENKFIDKRTQHYIQWVRMREPTNPIHEEGASETDWITVKQVMKFEDLSHSECYRRMTAGYSPRLVWMDRAGVDGRAGRLIDPRSMSPEARDRWRRDCLRQVANRNQVNASAAQGSLFERTEADHQIDALKLLGVPENEREVAIRRRNIAQVGLNHDWKAQGYRTKGEYHKAMAAANDTSVRNIQRWEGILRHGGGLLDLVRERPGPEPGETVLDPSMKAFLWDRRMIKGLKPKQCYDALIAYLTKKQDSPGCRVDHVYRFPSWATVWRYLDSLSPLDKAASEGSDAVKAACGYISRSYENLQAGEMWCIDEWQADAGAYSDEDARIYGRPWIVTLLDARSRFVLAWKAAFKYTHETVLDVVEAAVRKHGRPDFFYSDKGGRFRGRLGREFREIDKTRLLDPAASALELLGVVRRGPGKEKNPRGNPLERLHRIFAENARLLPTWCGSNTNERPEEYDARCAEHKEWTCGRAHRSGLILLSEVRNWFEGVLARYHSQPSSANGLHGLSPAAAYREFATDADRERRRVEPGLLLLAFAETFPGVTIRQGGVIEVGSIQYSNPELLLIQGERRDVRRARHDKSFVVVVPAFKGEEPLIARRRERVGTHDPESLSRESEMLGAIRKIAARPLPERERRAEARDERRETREPSAISNQRANAEAPARVVSDPLELRRALYRGEKVKLVEEELPDEAPLPRLCDLKPMTVEYIEEEPEAPLPRLCDLKPMTVEYIEEEPEAPLPRLHNAGPMTAEGA
jgi:transposase InsO family protein